MKYYIMTLGCQMNKSDGERLEGVLESLGLEKTENEEEAIVLGVMACSVRQRVIDRVYSKINLWEKRKRKENILTFVSGCILPEDEKKFLKKFDLLFRINELHKVPEMIYQYGIITPISDSIYNLKDNIDELKGFWKITPSYNSLYEVCIPIQNGCDKFCSFCAVPFTRGREVSRPLKEIINEIETLVNKGYKIITILGQNVNSYGKDLGTTFSELLEEIGKLSIRLNNENFWVYFTSPHPRDMGIDVLEKVAKYKVLANWIHLPIQSGNDKILIKMNRNHSMEKYRNIVRNVREILPDATLFTDIIVGFSTETRSQFEDTKAAMIEFKYNMAYIAMYSPRPGALSHKWIDDIDIEEKKLRRDELYGVLSKTAEEYCLNQIGKVFKIIIVSKIRDNYYSGRTEGKLVVRVNLDKDLIGEYAYVKIKSSNNLFMEGEYLDY